MTDEPRIEQGAKERFCHNCGAPNTAAYYFCARCGVRIDFLRPPPAAGLRGAYPVRFDVDYPQKLSRLSTLARLILAIPQLLIIYALGTVVSIVTLVAWFAILFTRRYPKGLFDLVVGFNRWIANVYVYTSLLRDEYPPFATDPGRYAVTYEVDYPERLSRWLIFVKWYLAILHQLVLYALGLLAAIVQVIAWFAILITGRFPRPFFNYIVGVMRWNLRVSAYTSLMTDQFPPYSKRADAGPGSRRAVLLTALLVIPAGIASLALLVGAFLLVASLTSSTEEVTVHYSDVLAGESTPAVEVEGNVVVLLGGDDPYDFPGVFREPRAGYRFVRFELEVTNIDSLFASVSRETLTLEDTRGSEHDPLLVQGATFGGELVEQGRTETVGVTFEVRNDADPAELTYAPGFRAFLPIGERVRFKFTGSGGRASLPRVGTPSPAPSPRTYDIIVSVDAGSVVSGSAQVDVGGLRVGPIEVEDPHPQAARALLADRTARRGARYIVFYIPIENVDAPTAIIEKTQFRLDATHGFVLDPGFITFGGNARDAITLDRRFSTLVGLVFEVDNESDPARLTYFPAFADPVAGGSHVVYFEFR